MFYLCIHNKNDLNYINKIESIRKIYRYQRGNPEKESDNGENDAGVYDFLYEKAYS